MLGGAFDLKKYGKFASKVAQSGFYIILFLCISAIGISGYVFYLARDTKETVQNGIDLPSAFEVPWSVSEEPVMPENPQDAVETVKEEPAKELKDDVKKQEEKKDGSRAPAIEKEETVYTMSVSGPISEPFSEKELVKSKTMGDWRIHSGVDIKAKQGSDVRAIAEGEVIGVLHDDMMGNTVKIQHTDGIISIYANLADAIEVKNGDTVKNGEVIGKIGNSALCECLEEDHLHLEVLKDGEHIDPLSLYPAGED